MYSGTETEDVASAYFARISKHKLLTREEETLLAKQIESGRKAATKLQNSYPGQLSEERESKLRQRVQKGKDAERRFVESNLRLVVSQAKKFQGSGLPLMDLVQEGNFGLMHAVEKFEWRKGFKFSTYAVWWIHQSIARGISFTNRNIRLPFHATETLTRIQKATARLTTELGRLPTPEEVSEATGDSPNKILETAHWRQDTLSLSDTLKSDSDTTLGDIIEDKETPRPEDVALLKVLPHEVAKMMRALENKEQEVLRMSYGLAQNGQAFSVDEISAKLQLPKDHVRRIKTRAISKLRHPSQDQHMRMLMP